MANRTPQYVYKIRKTVTNNKTGDNFALTVPTVIAEKFKDVDLFMQVTDTSITYESGCRIKK